MYIDNDDFSVWMQKLYAKLEELCKDVRVLRNADRVLPEDDKIGRASCRERVYVLV